MLTHVLSHLPPTTLSQVSLVSKRFHRLVTTPHAWRIAFSRFFPGAEALEAMSSSPNAPEEHDIHAEKRIFTRLTSVASWRSEYILRTRLLRSLSRGKPAEESGPSSSGVSRSGASSGGMAHCTYNSDLVTIVDRLDATFGTGNNKKLPRLIHGATDVAMASSSDPKNGKVDSWGFADAFTAQHFADVYPGDDFYGLGSGNIVGVPNTMDVSQLYGMVYVEGLPNGKAYYRSTEEKRGRELALPLDRSFPELGIPSISNSEAALTAVWVSKKCNVPDLSDGLIGIMVGSSQGVLSSYSLGTNPLRERRLERGELTARWVISPGVPIVAITVDENFAISHQSSKQISIVILNALGEVFYISDFPSRPLLDSATILDQLGLEKLAWETGRSIQWNIVGPSKRNVKKSDTYDDEPRSAIHSAIASWIGLGLSKQQIATETREIQTCLTKHPRAFRDSCDGWDMRRQLEVDFAGNSGIGAGENVFVISCSLDEGQQAEVRRFTCLQRTDSSGELNRLSNGMPALASHETPNIEHPSDTDSSADVNQNHVLIDPPAWSFDNLSSSSGKSAFGVGTSSLPNTLKEWRTSTFSFGDIKSPQITATAVDSSNFALITTDEDPLLGVTRASIPSSPMSSPLKPLPSPKSSSDIPGQRARLLAVGTKTGTIVLWNMRAPVASKIDLENNIEPVRVIRTDSPQISCLALTALYLVHGGNDGLVQAWDPLASSIHPIRTLNSRFSSRARRRLVQAEASPAGVGINLFAAGAICLDPDPTVLRGVVSLGSHLRYWSYSSNAADQYKGNKRRLRRSERGSNQSGDHFSGSGRGALKDYIANEKVELEREKRMKRKEDEKLSARYGVDLLGPGATEDEMLAYATLLSEETAKDDERRRNSASEDSSSDTTVEETVAPPSLSTQVEIDSDMAEAIRLSLQDSDGFRASSLGEGDASASNFTVRFKTSKKSSPSRSPPPLKAPAAVRKAKDVANATEKEKDDLDFVMQLSRAEEESRQEISEAGKKGKGRAREN